MKDVRITKESGSWNLKMTNGRHEFAEDGTEVAQHVLLRWMFFKGEYSLNGALTTKTELGTRWYEKIFNAAVSRVEGDLELKRVAMGTTGARRITKWNRTQTGNSVSIVGEGNTEWGNIDLSQEIEVL